MSGRHPAMHGPAEGDRLSPPPMSLQRLLVRVADACRQRAVLVVLAGAVCAALSLLFAAGHLGVTTDTSGLFSNRLSWRRAADEFTGSFRNSTIFWSSRSMPPNRKRPSRRRPTWPRSCKPIKRISPACHPPRRVALLPQGGFAVSGPHAASTLMDQTIAAQPFLGQLSPIPRRAGCFRRSHCSAWGRARSSRSVALFSGPARVR